VAPAQGQSDGVIGWWIALGGLVRAWAGATGGEDPVINAQSLRPSFDSERWIATDDAHLQAPGFLLRAPISYADDPLYYTFDDGQDLGLVSAVLQVDLMPSVQLWRVRVGLDLPFFALVNTRDYTGPSWGDVRIDGRAVVLDGRENAVGVAVDGGVGLPTGLTTMLRADEVTWDAALVLDTDAGASRVGLNMGVRGGPDRHPEGLHLDDALTVRLAYGYAFRPGLGLSVEALGLLPLTETAFAPGSVGLEWLAGGWARRDNIVMRVGAGTGIVRGVGVPDARIILAVGFEPPPGARDRDRDSVPNRRDGCPRDPEDREGVDDTDGCPELDPAPVVDGA